MRLDSSTLLTKSSLGSEIAIEYCPTTSTKEIVAKFFTKPLVGTLFKKF